MPAPHFTSDLRQPVDPQAACGPPFLLVEFFAPQIILSKSGFDWILPSLLGIFVLRRCPDPPKSINKGDSPGCPYHNLEQ